MDDILERIRNRRANFGPGPIAPPTRPRDGGRTPRCRQTGPPGGPPTDPPDPSPQRTPPALAPGGVPGAWGGMFNEKIWMGSVWGMREHACRGSRQRRSVATARSAMRSPARCPGQDTVSRAALGAALVMATGLPRGVRGGHGFPGAGHAVLGAALVVARGLPRGARGRPRSPGFCARQIPARVLGSAWLVPRGWFRVLQVGAWVVPRSAGWSAGLHACGLLSQFVGTFS